MLLATQFYTFVYQRQQRIGHHAAQFDEFHAVVAQLLAYHVQ